jgi:hypothetical protein
MVSNSGLKPLSTTEQLRMREIMHPITMKNVHEKLLIIHVIVQDQISINENFAASLHVFNQVFGVVDADLDK